MQEIRWRLLIPHYMDTALMNVPSHKNSFGEPAKCSDLTVIFAITQYGRKIPWYLKTNENVITESMEYI